MSHQRDPKRWEVVAGCALYFVVLFFAVVGAIRVLEVLA